MALDCIVIVEGSKVTTAEALEPPPPVKVTDVGGVEYPVPRLVTVTPVTAPPAEIVAVAVAPEPPPPMKPTVGGDVYPDPPLVTVIRQRA